MFSLSCCIKNFFYRIKYPIRSRVYTPFWNFKKFVAEFIVDVFYMIRGEDRLLKGLFPFGVCRKNLFPWGEKKDFIIVDKLCSEILYFLRVGSFAIDVERYNIYYRPIKKSNFLGFKLRFFVKFYIFLQNSIPKGQ